LKHSYHVTLLAAILIIGGCSGSTGGGSAQGDGAPSATTGGADTFAAAVQPIIQAKCAKCHIEGTKSDLSLASLESTLAGSKNGPDVLPGDSEGSLLYQMVSGQAEKTMPPKGEPLTADEIATIQRWIDAGAH
jgi:hypothetical protein